jgi:hypothetical protein
MAYLTDELTKVRPVPYLRKLQFSLVLVTLVLVTFYLASQYFGQETINLGEDGLWGLGKNAPETISSTKEILYEDTEKTKLEKQKAYKSVSPVFERDYLILTSQIKQVIDEDFENLRLVSSESSTKSITTLLAKVTRWKFRTTSDLETILNYPRKDKLRESVHRVTNLIFSSSCILKENSKEINISNGSTAYIINKNYKENSSLLDGTHIFSRYAIYNDKITKDRINKILEDKLTGLDSTTASVIKRLSFSYLYSFPNCIYRPTETEDARQKEVAKVKSIQSKINKGEVIVRKADLITPEIKFKLEKLNEHTSSANLNSIFSVLIVQIILVTIIITFLIQYDQKRISDIANNLILFSVIWILTSYTFIFSKIFFHPDSNLSLIYYFGLFIPIGMVCLMIGFIYDEQLSVAIGFYLSFFIFLSSQNNSTSFVIAFSTTVVAAISGRKIRKRIDFIKSGIYISAIQFLVVTSGYLIDSRSLWVYNSNISFFQNFISSNLFKVYLACFFNGLLCSVLTQFLLPVYEYIFNIPTRFKLQELADTGHPLLQALLTKAPSTYTHTFMVAALSERAAQNLGLDWLLVRAGVYFHDIGKIPNAGFFVENQHLIPKKENIDKNNPGKAAKIVIDHVIDGIEMAKKARLPREVISFIPEHHGTSTMAFFYHKALADLSPNQRKKINKKDFMYPGPKPQRKETAIVMIADSVEAASRSLEEITPHSLDELIQKIINIKLSENQLDECGLTLGDLSVIKSSFKEILLSSLHQRPKYPNTEDTKKLEQDQTKQTIKKK